MGLGEAEDESSLWNQSVQRCFSCARASSVFALGSEVGRASRDTAPRLELGLGWGAPGSGKCWTVLRNNSGGGNNSGGSQRFLQTQEARGLPWRDLVAWLTWHSHLPASEPGPVPLGLCFHLLENEDEAPPGTEPLPNRRGPPLSPLSGLSLNIHGLPWGHFAKETATGTGPPSARGLGPGHCLLLRPQGCLTRVPGMWRSLPAPALPRGQPGTEPPEITRSG